MHCDYQGLLFSSITGLDNFKQKKIDKNILYKSLMFKMEYAKDILFNLCIIPKTRNSSKGDKNLTSLYMLKIDYR